MKLIPLAPGHAWNRTDARIAHMNTFLNVLLQKSRVFGAKGIAAAFRAASDPRLKNQRIFMARSHIFFVVVKSDRSKATEDKKHLGAMVRSKELDGGKMGVRGLLYFDFSVIGPDKQLTHVPGYCRTREHANPDRPNNPTYVWTWRKDLTNTICQQCSDAWGGPVLLTTNGCTKKVCAVERTKEQKESQEVEDRRLPGMPLERQQQQQVLEEGLDQVLEEGNQRKKKNKKNTTTLVEESTTRQVRVVHGKGRNGEMEIWLYVPENKRDKNETQRKGWWLYPEKEKPGRYYIGPYEDVQKTKKKNEINDVVVFDDFPFTRFAEINMDGNEIPSTVRCVTDRPMTDEERKIAADGDDVEEARLDDGGSNESDDINSDCQEADSSEDSRSSDAGSDTITRSLSIHYSYPFPTHTHTHTHTRV